MPIINNPALPTLLKTLDDIQAIDVTTIDVHTQTTVTDFMVICSGRSSRHVKAIANQASIDMKKIGISILSMTGLETGDWILVDFGDFVLHIMQPTARAFYNLEGLWNDAE